MRNRETIIGNSAALALALGEISRLAPINRPVLIIGERGTGKELAADRLHYLSPRWGAPLIKINCAALAEPLLESELFGHEPGAFTGATQARQGRFERADGGSLFLDELGTMSLRLQEKLLRLVEYGEFERLGGQKTLQVDVRIIAATNTDLRQQAAAGEFRRDLLDRLSFDVVHLPALHERPEDIEELADHFAVQWCAELGWELFPGFTPDALQALREHRWPGNVRELKNAVERSIYRWGNPEEPVASIVIDPFKSPYSAPATNTLTPIADQTEPSTELDFAGQMAAIERQLLEQALVAHAYNQKRTATHLGLSYHQLRGMVRKYGLSKRRRQSDTD